MNKSLLISSGLASLPPPRDEDLSMGTRRDKRVSKSAGPCFNRSYWFLLSGGTGWSQFQRFGGAFRVRSGNGIRALRERAQGSTERFGIGAGDVAFDLLVGLFPH